MSVDRRVRRGTTPTHKLNVTGQPTAIIHTSANK